MKNILPDLQKIISEVRSMVPILYRTVLVNAKLKSVAQSYGCRIFIPDPNFSIPDPGSRVKKIRDLGSSSKNLSIFSPKTVSTLSEK